MKYGQRPRKKRRVWLPLTCGLLLAIGSGYLWRAGFDKPSPQVQQPATDVTPKQEPSPPAPASAADRPQTGKIRQSMYDRNMAALAVSFKQASVYLRPSELQEEQKAVDQLAELLKLPAEKLQTDLRTERNFVWLKRNLNAETAKKIAESHYNGVYLVDELQRYYPFHEHAAHVVGFVKDGLGLTGAEFIYDTIMSGDRTLAQQHLNLPGLDPNDIPEIGAGVVLSIDIDLQIILEKKLQHLQQETAAKSARAVLIEAGTGEILAMAEVPTYDPNIYWKASNSAHQNRILNEAVPIGGINAFLKAAAELTAGNLPPELASREEIAERIINPRVMKIIKGDVPAPSIQESQVWQPGIHLSPPFQWPLKFNQKDAALSSFCTKLGLAAAGSGLAENRSKRATEPQGADGTCSLDDEAWSTSPLNLLAAFSQLTNGGQAILPHMLRGIWKTDDATFHPTSFKADEAIAPQASSDFISFVKGLQAPGPGDDLIIESTRSTAKAPATERIKIQDDGPPASIEDSLRFSSMTLGVGRQGEHQLALIIIADDAKLNLSRLSPFRKAAAEIVTKGQALMTKRWSNEIMAPQLESDALLYQKWSLAQSLGKAPAAIETMVNPEMPDLVGMSLRKAMQSLQGYNVKISAQGTGRVVRQSPAAGVRLKGVTETKLELQMDN